MNLTISGHHLDVTPALRSYVTGKLDRITRHFDQVELSARLRRVWAGTGGVRGERDRSCVSGSVAIPQLARRGRRVACLDA